MFKVILKRTVLLVVLALIYSCDEDDGSISTFDASEFLATSVKAESTIQNGNPSDVMVSFEAASRDSDISEYRVVYLQSSASLPETTTASEFTSSNSKSVSNGQSNYSLALNQGQLSFDGGTFELLQNYQAYVVSLGSVGNEQVVAISEPSETFSISEPLDSANFKPSNISISLVETNGNAADVEVSFDAAPSTGKIQEYRIIVAKAATSVNAQAAQTLASDQYAVATSGASPLEVDLSEDLLDFTGDAVTEGVDYQVFVLTVGSLNGGNVYVLSDPSMTFQLTRVLKVSTLITDINANDAISIDGDGNLYISDYGDFNSSTFSGTGEVIIKVTPSGEQSTFTSGLTGPVGNAIDADGNLYVNSGSNFSSGNLTKIAADGTLSVVATIAGYPAGILLGSDGNTFISNYWSPVLSQVSADGTVSSFVEDNQLFGGVGIAYDDEGNILMGNQITGEILSVAPDATITVIATLPTVEDSYVIGYITYFEGNVYATGIGANIIYKVSLDGTITNFAGTGEEGALDGELDQATFNDPNGIAVDKNNRLLYVTDRFGGLRVMPID